MISTKIEQKVEAEFIDEWENGFGLFAQTEEKNEKDMLSWMKLFIYLTLILGLKYLNRNGKVG